MNANFRIRCSQIGKIMTEARSKSEPLSKTTIAYLEEWAKEQIYQRKKVIVSKYIDKGLAVENDAIEYLSVTFPDLPLLIKNEKYFEDEWMTGTPDLILSDHIIDIKSSWDCFTFPLFEQDLPEKDYYWQMQGYMHLTGRKKSKVIYILMDTPEEIVDKEVRFDPDNEEEIRARHSYKSIPAKYRIKEFTVYRNQEDIEKIKARVEECRKYIETL